MHCLHLQKQWLVYEARGKSAFWLHKFSAVVVTSQLFRLYDVFHIYRTDDALKYAQLVSLLIN